MVELSKTLIGGILTLIIILSSGTTYFIEKTGDYDNCRGEWLLQEDGMYQCQQDQVKQWCFEIEERGSGWYRCWLGKVVLVEESIVDTTEKSLSKKIRCNGKVWVVEEGEYLTPYTKLKSGSYEGYLGECI